jgi:ribulose kinase
MVELVDAPSASTAPITGLQRNLYESVHNNGWRAHTLRSWPVDLFTNVKKKRLHERGTTIFANSLPAMEAKAAITSSVAEKPSELQSETRATDVAFDLLGFTLTIDGNTVTLSHEAIRAMSHVISNLESETVEKLRREMAAERGPY